MPPALRIVHTADLLPDELRAVRDLLDAAFADDPLTADDWEHCLGGLHALAHDGGRLVGHGALVQRRLLHGGRALRCGYVEGVATHPDARRRGHFAAVMAALERAADAACDLGALAATDLALPLYRARGWVPWRGELAALTPDGVRPTPDEAGGVLVRATPAVPLDLDAPLVADWRDGDVW